MDFNLRDFPDNLRNKIGAIAGRKNKLISVMTIELIESGINKLCNSDKNMQAVLADIDKENNVVDNEIIIENSIN